LTGCVIPAASKSPKQEDRGAARTGRSFFCGLRCCNVRIFEERFLLRKIEAEKSVPLQPSNVPHVESPGYSMEETRMRKALAVLAMVAAVAATSVTASAPAQARGFGPGLGFGLAAGALAAGAYGAYGYYGPGYGYYGPRYYGYGPAYYGPGPYAYYGGPYYGRRYWRHW